jgi:hypothetical protein
MQLSTCAAQLKEATIFRLGRALLLRAKRNVKEVKAVQRILLILTVALVMAAMVVATAAPAFAGNPETNAKHCAKRTKAACINP